MTPPTPRPGRALARLARAAASALSLGVALSATLSLSACGSSHVITPFPPGIAPKPLEALAADPTPSPGQLITAHGERDGGGAWVEGRAVIPEPIDDVVATFLSDPALMVDPEGIASFEATWDVEPDYPHSVRIQQVTSGLVSVTFDVTWRMAPQLEPDGTMAGFAAVYQKTAGTSLIKQMQGSITARKLTPFATELAFYAAVDAPTITGEDLATSVGRMFEGLRARVSGAPR